MNFNCLKSCLLSNQRPLTGDNSVDYGSAIDSDDGLENDDIKLSYRDFVKSFQISTSVVNSTQDFWL